MYQHQHARLPVEQLKDVPEPVVVLLEALLEKDPARRFQNPTELGMTFGPMTSGRNFVPKCDLMRYCNVIRDCLRNGTRVCTGAVLTDFAPIGGEWCCFWLRMRLNGD